MNARRKGRMASDMESDFLDRCRNGEREALRLFVDRYYDRIFRLAYTMLGPGEAHDLAQETFAGAMSGLKNFRGDAQVYSWLVSILRNQYSLFLRRRKKWAMASLDAVSEPPMPEEESFEPGVRLILERVRTLSEDLRTTLMLFYLDGLRYEEIAKAMNCPVGTVRSRLYVAREQLKKSFSTEQTS